MMKRFVTVAALMTGATLFCLPTHAQTGTTGQSTINSGGASPSGSMGTTSNTPRSGGPATSTMSATGGATANSPGMNTQGTMSSQSGSMGAQSGMGAPSGAQGSTMGAQGNMGGQANVGAGAGMNYQAQATGGSRRMRGDAAERQVTECLNNAMSQGQPLNSCRR